MYKFIYVSLGILLLISYIWAGRKYENIRNYGFKRDYWKIAIVPILMYSVFYGLRFGRLVDYNVYYDRYVAIGKNFAYGHYELLFRAIVNGLVSIGVPYWIFIWLCSVFLAASMLLYYKNMKDKMAMAFILPLSMYFSGGVEQLIRWYLAAAFFLISLYFFRSKKYIYYTVFVACACLTHYGFFFMIPFALLLFVNKSIIPTKVAIVVFLLSVFLGTTQMLIPYTEYLSTFVYDEKSETYVNNMERILSGKFHNGIFLNNIIGDIRNLLMYIFPLIIGHHLLKAKLIDHRIYNLYKIAIILYPVFSTVEILDRYSQTLMLISCPVVCGKSFYYIYRNYKSVSYYEFALGVMSFVGFLQVFFWKKLFIRNEWYQMLFIWDADGREKLPIQYFINY